MLLAKHKASEKLAEDLSRNQNSNQGTTHHSDDLADELRGAIDTVVTTEQLEAAMTRLTFRLAAIVGAMMAVGLSAVGVLTSLNH